MITSCIFITFISVFFALHIFIPDSSFSESENRNLQTLPSFSWGDLTNGKYSTQITDYAVDQFPYRNFFVSLKATNEWVLGKLENNGVYLAQDSVLIDKFLYENNGQLDTNIKKVSNFINNVDIPISFTIVPTQNDIYGDLLPKHAPTVDQKELIDYVGNYIDQINIYDTLKNHNDEYIYYYTDHHWTSLGAYYAYAEIISLWGYTPVPLESYTANTLTTDFLGTTDSKNSLSWTKADTITTYVPNQEIIYSNNSGEHTGHLYDTSLLEQKNKYEIFLGGNPPLAVINGQGEGKLLMIRDSYSNALVPFFIEHFEEIHMVDMRTLKLSMSNYIAEHQIDLGLICYGLPNFATDKNLVFLR